MSMSVLCYASAVLVALLHITLLGKHPLPTSPACNTLACQLCILHSLPPLQAAWILAIGVACRFALQRRRCLGASIAAMLTSLLATPLLVSFAFFIPCHLCRQPGLWGLALLAGLCCSVGRCLGASIAAMLASLLATPIACEPDQCVCFIPCHLCKQPELWESVLRADLHCSVGVVWVDQHCCHDGIMACQHSLCWCALLLPRIAWLPTFGACCSLGIAVQTALANLL